MIVTTVAAMVKIRTVGLLNPTDDASVNAFNVPPMKQYANVPGIIPIQAVEYDFNVTDVSPIISECITNSNDSHCFVINA